VLEEYILERGRIQCKSGITANLWSICPSRKWWDGQGSRIRRLRRSPRAARTQDVSPTDTDGVFGPHSIRIVNGSRAAEEVQTEMRALVALAAGLES